MLTAIAISSEPGFAIFIENNMQSIDQRLAEGPPILLDGAMGSELERRGVPMDDHAWCGAAVAASPDTVREIHRDYLLAGAEVHIVNTYASAPHMLAWAGLEADAESLNRNATRLALEARERTEVVQQAWIAGSMSTFNGANTTPLTTDTVVDSWRRQAEWLTESGCELLVLEMMLVNRLSLNLEQQGKLLDIAHDTGLPVWYGISCKTDDGRSARLYNDSVVGRLDHQSQTSTLEEAIATVDFDKVRATGIMHSDVPAIRPGLELLRAHTNKPLLAYPNSGYFKLPAWQFEDIIPVPDFVQDARSWVEQGVRVVGGCCGLGPEHIRGLREIL